MTDSSLTTLLSHLKNLYYTHMGGLVESGSHGLRESSELQCLTKNTHSGHHAGNRLYIKQPPPLR